MSLYIIEKRFLSGRKGYRITQGEQQATRAVETILRNSALLKRYRQRWYPGRTDGIIESCIVHTLEMDLDPEKGVEYRVEDY